MSGLRFPSGPGGRGDATTTADLSENAWAGARVTMTLHARDEGGNEGASEPIEILLPQRPFVKPLARALVEQRRNLVLAPDARARVETSLEALTIAPEHFGTNAGIYLGLHSALYRLKRARTDPELLGVADYLWEMALRIEDGDLSDAERDLRAAQQQLREALQRGADDAGDQEAHRKPARSARQVPAGIRRAADARARRSADKPTAMRRATIAR